MSSPSQINVKQADIAVPTRHLGSLRPPNFFENFALTKIKHGHWTLVSGSASFSGAILTLHDASLASELKSVPKFMYGSLLIYAKLADTNSIIGFDDGEGNHVRITNDQFQVANGEAGTSNTVAVTIDETAYHNYLIVWNSFGCELWIDGVLQAKILDVIPHTELPIRLYSPAAGYLYVNSAELYQDVPHSYDPFGKQFMPKDLNRLIPSVNPTGKILWQDPADNSKGMDVKNWQRYWNSALPPTIQNETTQNKVFMGGQSILLQSAAEANKYCGVVKNLPYLPSKRLGIEGFFAFDDWQYIEYIGFMIDRYTMTDYKAALIRYKPLTVTTGKLQYVTGSGSSYNWTDFNPSWSQWLYYTEANAGWGEKFQYYHYFKLIADFDAMKYVFLQVDDQRSGVEQVDVSTLSLQTYTIAIEYGIYDFAFEIMPNAAQAIKVWLGMVIITDEELG